MKSEISAQVELGATPCYLIKNIYYPDKAWIDCYKEVANQFTTLKKIIRKKAPLLEELEILRMVSRFTLIDITEILEEETE